MSGAGALPVIEGYRVLSRLGSGAMGTVWRAIDRRGRVVAVKLADSATKFSDTSRDELFRREALVALNLRHACLVRGIEVGETADGHPFLAMEFVTGETLRQRMQSDGPVPERELVAVGLALASALEHAHGFGLVHRDVKPENVMLRSDGTVCLVDLGLAVEIGRGQPGVGTPAYASPEMLLKREVGPSADLYSLGVTLASAALGRPFFDGPDVKSIARANLRTDVTLPDRVRDEPVSEGLRAVVRRLTRKGPSQRYSSAGEARLDFEALSHGERPLGALLGLARLHPARRPGRWIAAAAVVAATATVVVVTSDRGPPALAPRPAASAVTPAVPDNPRVEATLLYLESHPDEFQTGRRLVAEARAAPTTAAQRERIDAAAERIESRSRAAAEALLAERTAQARALAAEGQISSMVALLSSWPSELAGAQQEAQAQDLARVLRAEALAPGERFLAEGDASLDRWARGGDDGLDGARDFAMRLERFLSDSPRIAEQSSALEALRGRVAAAMARLARARHEASSSRALASYLSKAAAGDAEGARAALEHAGDAADGAPDVAPDVVRLASAVASCGKDVEAALARRITPLALRPWAGVLDNRWYFGVLDAVPSPRRVFLPVPPASPLARTSSPDFADLLDAEPDADRAASWLVLSAAPYAASWLAPEGSPSRRLLEAAGVRRTVHPASADGAWADIVLRAPMLTRSPDGPVPERSGRRDLIVDAWREAVVASRLGSLPPSPPSSSASVAAARAAFVAGDWLGAWSALEAAVAASPREAEVAILRCRVLEGLGKPLRTRAVSLLAFSEARRAWDLDPSVPTASRLVAEQGIAFRRRHPGPWAESLAPVTLAACEEAARLGQATTEMLSIAGELRLAESQPRLAAQWLRRAAREAPDDPAVSLLLARAEDALGESRRATEALRAARDRLGDKFPAWAREMLARLSAR
jgi:hypothetical protein